MDRGREWKIVLALVLLLVGGCVYLLFRPQTLVMFRLADAMGLSPAISAWRTAVTALSLPEWCVFCLPNGLWSAAYILLADILADGSRRRLLTAAFIPVVGVVSEALQRVGLLPGTFDWLDLVAYVLPYVIYVMIIKQKTIEYEINR